MNLYRNIDRTKVQFDFVENEGEQAAFDEEILALGGRIYRCPRYRGKNHFAYTKWWNTFFAAHKGEYPIVHGHIGSTAAIYLSVAKRCGAYTIAHSHSAGISSAIYRVFAYPTRYVADHFFACSKDAGISRYGSKVGNNTERCQVLNNAIDTQQYAFNLDTRCQLRRSLHIAEHGLVIGHVGRFVNAKNHLFLLEVFAEIRNRQCDAMLLLVGDGELRPQIEAAIAEKNLQNAVILAGVQSNVNDYLQAMDVMVFPSLYEGLPVTLVEAQTAGLPCVISNFVPKECILTEGLVTVMDLNELPSAWAEHALRRAEIQRTDRSEELRRCGYDIGQTSAWLGDFYERCTK